MRTHPTSSGFTVCRAANATSPASTTSRSYARVALTEAGAVPTRAAMSSRVGWRAAFAWPPALFDQPQHEQTQRYLGGQFG